MESLLKIGEVAQFLSVSTSCIYKKAERGEIKSIKIGTSLRFKKQDIEEYVEKCANTKSNEKNS